MISSKKSTMHWHYTTLHYTTLHYTTLRRTTQHTARDPYGSYTSSQMSVYILQTKCKQLRACIWSGSLSCNFSVTAFWTCIFQPGELQNFNTLIY